MEEVGIYYIEHIYYKLQFRICVEHFVTGLGWGSVTAFIKVSTVQGVQCGRLK